MKIISYIIFITISLKSKIQLFSGTYYQGEMAAVFCILQILQRFSC